MDDYMSYLKQGFWIFILVVIIITIFLLLGYGYSAFKKLSMYRKKMKKEQEMQDYCRKHGISLYRTLHHTFGLSIPLEQNCIVKAFPDRYTFTYRNVKTTLPKYKVTEVSLRSLWELQEIMTTQLRNSNCDFSYFSERYPSLGERPNNTILAEDEFLTFFYHDGYEMKVILLKPKYVATAMDFVGDFEVYMNMHPESKVLVEL